MRDCANVAGSWRLGKSSFENGLDTLDCCDAPVSCLETALVLLFIFPSSIWPKVLHMPWSTDTELAYIDIESIRNMRKNHPTSILETSGISQNKTKGGGL